MVSCTCDECIIKLLLTWKNSCELKKNI
jgi:hypothetical protein